jgi:hypothetical protein
VTNNTKIGTYPQPICPNFAVAMSDPYEIILLLKKKVRLKMRKPRMTKSEKQFVERIVELCFSNPDYRKGNITECDIRKFNTLTSDEQHKFFYLINYKTR